MDNPLRELEQRLRTQFPVATIDVCDAHAPNGVAFLDVTLGNASFAVQWQKDWHFGVTSPDGHGYGEKPDEVYGTLEEIEARLVHLLKHGGRTQAPPEVTLRELRTERKLPQVALAALLEVSQPAISRLERRVNRMMIASLQAVVHAMGGRLVIQAHFPDGVRQIAIDEDPCAEIKHTTSDAVIVDK